MEFYKEEKIFLIRDEQTNPSYGNFPEKRSIDEYLRNGIVNLDKPKGLTSHQVSKLVGKILNAKKVGYSGTLDVNVTGILPILLNNSTKVAPVFILMRKKYVGILRLHKDVKIEEIRKIFNYFHGKIYQKPPLKSAVKRELRVRTIYSLKILEKEGRNVLFEVECESGTYVRKLCHDIGLLLGVGANMQELRRIKVGCFDEGKESRMTNLYELKDAYEFYHEEGNEELLRKVVLPIEKVTECLRKIWISDNAIDAICHGSNLYAPGVCKLNSGIKKNELIAIMSLKNELVALGRSIKSSDEILNSTSGAIAKPERVIMKEGTYPKFWKKNISKIKKIK